jgi:hypothetical protein
MGIWGVPGRYPVPRVSCTLCGLLHPNESLTSRLDGEEGGIALGGCFQAENTVIQKKEHFVNLEEKQTKNLPVISFSTVVPVITLSIEFSCVPMVSITTSKIELGPTW